jgi:hypothetical protein
MEKSRRSPQILLKEEYNRLRNTNAFIYLDDLKATYKHHGFKIGGIKKKDLIDKLDILYSEEEEKIEFK